MFSDELLKLQETINACAIKAKELEEKSLHSVNTEFFWHNAIDTVPIEGVPIIVLVSGKNGGMDYDNIPAVAVYSKENGFEFLHLIEYKDSKLHCNYFAYIPIFDSDEIGSLELDDADLNFSYKIMKMKKEEKDEEEIER